MSNPAVVKLQEKRINGQYVWLDDNFGESIHIHIDNFRADLTIEEFKQMCSDICDAINSCVAVDGFDCHYINPVYMECLLWENLPRLCGVKIENVALKDMLCPAGRDEMKKLPESRGVKALNGDTKENDEHRNSLYCGQSSRERLDVVFKSIKEHGYPYGGEYIIMYGDDNIIMDGQHRASCLWKLKGDIEVPVMRLYFKNYKPLRTVVPSWKKNGIYQSIRKSYHLVRSPKMLYQWLRSQKKAMQLKRKQRQRESYVSKNYEIVQSVEAVFDNK